MNKERFKSIVALLLAVSLVLSGMNLQTVSAALVADGTRADASDVVQATSDNKKGIQGTEFEYGTWPDSEPESLGINHILLNVDLAEVINTDQTGEPYVYNGKTYYFNYESYVKMFEMRAVEYRKQGIALTFVILLSWSDDPVIQNLIYPGARETDHRYYALNVDDASAKEQLDATLHYLTDTFGQKDCFVQNWIIGNEVNMPEEYNYTGTTDLATNADICAKSFDMLYAAIQDNSPYSKAYISLTNTWNYDDEGKGMATKAFIDAFAAKETDKNWNIAFHAYPPFLDVQCWSREAATWLRNDEHTLYVCAANLNILTDYVKNTYGSSHRIILSEQGFDANSGLDEQAAMTAYTYYAAARNDMVDAVMFLSWEDDGAALDDGYRLGFVADDGTKRPVYNVFKYMDTAQASQYVDKYLATMGISSWTDSIIYTPAATDATITSTSLFVSENGPTYVKAGITPTTSKDADLEFRWTAIDPNGNQIVISEWIMNYEWITWFPPMNGRYELTAQVRVAGNESASTSYTRVIYYNTSVDAVLNSAEIEVLETSDTYVKMNVVTQTSAATDIEYKWYAVGSDGEMTPLSDWIVNNSSYTWVYTVPDNYGIVVEVRVVGNPTSSLRPEKFVDLSKADATDAVLTSAKLYMHENNSSHILIGIQTELSKEAPLQYKWTATDSSGNSYVVSDWMTDNMWLDWTPSAPGEYTLTGEVRVAGNTESYVKLTKIVYFNYTVSATVTDASLQFTYKSDSYAKMNIVANTTEATHLEYCWTALSSAGEIIPLSDWIQDDAGFVWYPEETGTYILLVDVRVVGNPSSAIRVQENNVTFTSLVTVPEVTGVSLFTMENTRDHIFIGAVAETTTETSLQYKWTAVDTSGNSYLVQDWTTDNEWLDWVPPTFGEFTLTAEVRAVENPSSSKTVSEVVYFNPHIKGKCQMPYWGEGGGYLIGVESYENPNQSYYYEMLILDCTLLAKGEDAWVYTTGLYKVDEGNAGWCIWQPQYGYYWTLFRVYDADGNMLDQACYGFANAY